MNKTNERNSTDKSDWLKVYVSVVESLVAGFDVKDVHRTACYFADKGVSEVRERFDK